MLLALNSISHFLVDALCVSTLFCGAAAGEELAVAVVLYNSLAFSTQCLVGLLTDAVGRHGRSAVLALLLVLLGWALPAPFLVRISLVGLGNSLFHVAGGSMTLEQSGGRAGKLGVFVAPGAFGVTLGTLFPNTAIIYAAAMLACLLAYIYICLRHPELFPEKKRSETARSFPLLAVVLLACAVAVRAVGGSAVSFPWKDGAAMAVLMTSFVFAGKCAGGFVCDKFGAKIMSLISIPLAALLIAFCAAYALPSLAGQFLLNLSMPVTLFLMYKALPDSPGFAFGLAASALWPGTIAGQLMTLTGSALWICVIVCFIFGLAAIIYADKKIKEVKYE